MNVLRTDAGALLTSLRGAEESRGEQEMSGGRQASPLLSVNT